jgi:hypothetical protein
MRTKLLHALWLGALVVLMVPSMGGCADVLRSVSDSAGSLANAINGTSQSDNLRHDLGNVWDDLFK